MPAHQSRPPVSERSLTLYNRQRTRPLNLRQLRVLARHLLQHELSLSTYDLAIHLVAEFEMTHLNETHLHHQGSTDVITFNYSEDPRPRVSPALPRTTSTQSRRQNSFPAFHSGLE